MSQHLVCIKGRTFAALEGIIIKTLDCQRASIQAPLPSNQIDVATVMVTFEALGGWRRLNPDELDRVAAALTAVT